MPDLVASVGMETMAMLITAELTKFIESYTVVRPMNADQIVECAFSILSSSEEDKLSLQDLILFFEGAKQGKYGRILDHIDQHVIFEMMEIYRQERHIKYLNIKDEQHTMFKSIGDNKRSSDDNEKEEMDIRSAVVDYYKQKFTNEPDNA